MVEQFNRYEAIRLMNLVIAIISSLYPSSSLRFVGLYPTYADLQLLRFFFHHVCYLKYHIILHPLSNIFGGTVFKHDYKAFCHGFRADIESGNADNLFYEGSPAKCLEIARFPASGDIYSKAMVNVIAE